MAMKLDLSAADTVTCRVCSSPKLRSEFYPSSLKRGQRTCKPCLVAEGRARRAANPDKAREYQAKWYSRNRAQAAAASKAWEQKNRAKRTARQRDLRATGWKVDYDLKSRYGITVADYQQLLAAQGGVCACCGAGSAYGGRRLYVDHCHVTGEIRGLICHRCNAGIGMLGDDPAGVVRALTYLDRSSTAGCGAGLLC